MVSTIWDGHDYLPQVFDDWLASPGGAFEAGELDGLVVAVHRWKPIQRGVAYYEGMRVAPEVQRRGIGRTILRSAIEQVRGLGYEVLRLATGNPDALTLFESEGFRRRTGVAVWHARRQEGGEPARIPPAAEADRLQRGLEADPAWGLYDRLDPLPAGPRDLDGAYLGELLQQGRVRQGAGGRALVLVGPGFGGRRLYGTLVAGAGGALQDLLLALRFEADADGLEGVGLLIPPGHPAERDLQAVGYSQPDLAFEYSVLDLTL